MNGAGKQANPVRSVPASYIVLSTGRGFDSPLHRPMLFAGRVLQGKPVVQQYTPAEQPLEQELATAGDQGPPDQFLPKVCGSWCLTPNLGCDKYKS